MLYLILIDITNTIDASIKKALVLVAHTDDETFGYGGFIKKLSKLNYNRF